MASYKATARGALPRSKAASMMALQSASVTPTVAAEGPAADDDDADASKMRSRSSFTEAAPAARRMKAASSLRRPGLAAVSWVGPWPEDGVGPEGGGCVAVPEVGTGEPAAAAAAGAAGVAGEGCCSGCACAGAAAVSSACTEAAAAAAGTATCPAVGAAAT